MFKKITQFIMMVCTVLFLFGTIGILVEQPNKAYAAQVTSIGFVDYMFLMEHHPDMQKTNETFKTELEQAKDTFAKKSADMTDQDKKTLEITLNQQIEKRRQELFQEISSKVNAGIKAVAEAKGLSIIIPKSMVIYGGSDITDAVMAKLKG